MDVICSTGLFSLKSYRYQDDTINVSYSVNDFNQANKQEALNHILIRRFNKLYSKWLEHFRACINYPSYAAQTKLTENQLIKIKNDAEVSKSKLLRSNPLKDNALIIAEEIVPLLMPACFDGSELYNNLKILLKDAGEYIDIKI